MGQELHKGIYTAKQDSGSQRSCSRDAEHFSQNYDLALQFE
jgi:hypothetical protein